MVRLEKHIKQFPWARIFIVVTAVSFLGIKLPENQSKDAVLAKIGSKEITVREFLERSELTVRPNNFKDKYITLNNLISEKILAIEAEQNNKLQNNPIFEGTLKGIKEQSMRDKLFKVIAADKVELNDDEIKNAYKASMREYELEFYSFKNKELAGDIESILDTVPQLTDELFRQLEAKVGKKPIQKVSFKDPEDDAIHVSLFSNPLDTGTVVGPLKLTNGDYIVMKVFKWVDYPLLGGEEQSTRWNKVKEKLHEIKARKLWLSYQTQLMKGKKFEFDKDSFNKITDLAMENYLNTSGGDSLNNRLNDIPLPKTDIDPSAPFFTVDNKVWSAEDFRNQLISHPLVFRTKKLDKKNFKEQFKLAVVDMMRNYYLTKEAYERSLDKDNGINNTVDMWKDSFLANVEMNDVIKSALNRGIISRDNNLGMLKYKESYLRDIQNKHGHLVWINYKELDKINLTTIDFVAARTGVPFPFATPNFPILIRSENLDYAKKK